MGSAVTLDTFALADQASRFSKVTQLVSTRNLLLI
jgi:hypothetical protein